MTNIYCINCGHVFVSAVNKPQCGNCGSRNTMIIIDTNMPSLIDAVIKTNDNKLTKLSKNSLKLSEDFMKLSKQLNKQSEHANKLTDHSNKQSEHANKLSNYTMKLRNGIIQHDKDIKSHDNDILRLSRMIGVGGLAIIYYILRSELI